MDMQTTGMIIFFFSAYLLYEGLFSVAHSRTLDKDLGRKMQHSYFHATLEIWCMPVLAVLIMLLLRSSKIINVANEGTFFMIVSVSVFVSLALAVILSLMRESRQSNKRSGLYF